MLLEKVFLFGQQSDLFVYHVDTMTHRDLGKIAVRWDALIGLARMRHNGQHLNRHQATISFVNWLISISTLTLQPKTTFL